MLYLGRVGSGQTGSFLHQTGPEVGFNLKRPEHVPLGLGRAIFPSLHVIMTAVK